MTFVRAYSLEQSHHNTASVFERYLNTMRFLIDVGLSSLPTETEVLSDVVVDDVMRTAIMCLKNTLQHVHAQTSLIDGLRVFYVRSDVDTTQ